MKNSEKIRAAENIVCSYFHVLSDISTKTGENCVTEVSVRASVLELLDSACMYLIEEFNTK